MKDKRKEADWRKDWEDEQDSETAEEMKELNEYWDRKIERSKLKSSIKKIINLKEGEE
jgi:hypothetical protein